MAHRVRHRRRRRAAGARLVRRLAGTLCPAASTPKASDPYNSCARAGGTESLAPVEGVVVEHPAAVRVAAELEPLGCAVARQLDSRCRDPGHRPRPITVDGFGVEPDPTGDMAHPMSQPCTADPAIQGGCVTSGERACPCPSPEDRAQLIAQGGQLADRRRVRRANLESMPAQEPRAPFRTGKPVEARPLAQMIGESAVDQVDAGVLARVPGDSRRDRVRHGLMPPSARRPLHGTAHTRPMAAVVLIVDPW